MKGQEIKAEEGSCLEIVLDVIFEDLFENKRFSLGTLSLEKAPLDALSLKKPL